MNNFQTVLVAIFLACFVFGVLVFSGVLNFGSKKTANTITGNIVIWGTLPASQINEIINSSIVGAGDTFTIKYVEQNKDTYEANLIDAFANDKGPDLFILPQDMILKNINFISKIPYSSYSKSTFQKTFIDGADVLLAKDGIIGFPLLVDPMVLYYNKNILSNESILYPAKTWDEFFNLAGKLIKKNKDGTIAQAMVALGQYDNVNHAKDIFSLLLLQSGSPIVSQTDTGYTLDLNSSSVTSNGKNPAEQIIEYFLEFSNPSKSSYTWNRSMPNSLDSFTAGKLAFYVGYASELFNIESVNPNLSFDVTTIPQTTGMENKRTYGQMYTVVASKKSKNLSGALMVASKFTGSDFLKSLSNATSIPSASRALLSEKPEDPYLASFFDSVIVSRTWLDPDFEVSEKAFKELMENSISNRLSVGEALDKMTKSLNILLQQNYE